MCDYARVIKYCIIITIIIIIIIIIITIIIIIPFSACTECTHYHVAVF